MNRSFEFCSSIKELSEYLGVSYTKASILIKDPGLPKIIFGTRKIFPKSQVKSWWLNK